MTAPGQFLLAIEQRGHGDREGTTGDACPRMRKGRAGFSPSSIAARRPNATSGIHAWSNVSLDIGAEQGAGDRGLDGFGELVTVLNRPFAWDEDGK